MPVNADISALIAALVPAVTKGVVDTLTSTGAISQGKEKPEATTSHGSSTCTQNTSDILTQTDNNTVEDLQTLVDLQWKITK